MKTAGSGWLLPGICITSVDLFISGLRWLTVLMQRFVGFDRNSRIVAGEINKGVVLLILSGMKGNPHFKILFRLLPKPLLFEILTEIIGYPFRGSESISQPFDICQS